MLYNLCIEKHFKKKKKKKKKKFQRFLIVRLKLIRQRIIIFNLPPADTYASIYNIIDE
jgi:hypothetical protein